MKFLSLLCAALFGLSGAADEFSDVTVKATALRGGVHMLEGAGGNITALIGPEGTFLVDDDFAPMATKLVAKLEELGGGIPRFIVNTHFHYDHTGGNEIFGTSATIIAATAVRDRLATEQILWKETHPAEPARALPTLTFEHSMTLHLNGETVLIKHLPHGHTDGDSVVFFKEARVVSLGDLYFSGMFPIFHPEHNGSLEGYIHDLEALLEQIPEDARIVPGHGPLTGKAELRRFVRMIRATVAAVRRGVHAGYSLQRIQKIGLDHEWDDFSHGYLTKDQWIALVFKNAS